MDHIPSPAELLAAYESAAQNDPTSVFYKRVLVRPRLPAATIVLSLLLTAAACVLAWVFTARMTQSHLWGMVACIGLLILLILIFAKKILITTVKVYQALAPEKTRCRCRYEPSCSAYMILAVEKYGFWKGFRKGMRRWSGCKPPNGGFDMP